MRNLSAGGRRVWAVMAASSRHELATTPGRGSDIACERRRRLPLIPRGQLPWRQRPNRLPRLRQLSCQVNGEPIQLDLPEAKSLTLLDVLRDFLGITSPKNGCQPQAQCGCCTVLMDGKPVLSCALVAGEGRGQIDHHARRARRRASAADCRIVRALRRRAVRLLHSRHGDARRRAVREEPDAEPRGNRDARSSRICAAAPVTRRSSTASSCTASCGAASRCRSRRRPTGRAASAPICRATRATTPCLATASSSTT